MRLTNIKLSGFKSFAEPIHFQLPGQRVAVVGPNGCGKSNIIDAVRWVLGESRASELRGESMQDVIFSGTDLRKPASRASVELVFDNSDHRAGGQWNQYSEIAVKRVLTRDGNSSYVINGQVVRRRDIHDVFLGTGLGPRAYAIIGQGTISRIIESRPEEMRLFLEEAAGVSKYKERRRETENRLHDTHENLTRVEDILRELGSSIARLEKQAEVAKRYHALKDQGTLRLHQFWWLKQQAAQTDLQVISVQIAQAQASLEERVTGLRKKESDLETIRQTHYAAGDTVNQAQGRLYETSAAVGKLEAEIKFVVDGKSRAEQRVREVRAQISSWQERQVQAEHELEDAVGQVVASEEQLMLLAAQCEEDGEQTPELEEALRQKQKDVAKQRDAVVAIQQQIQLLASEQRMFDEQLRALVLRQERLMGEKKQLSVPNEAHLKALREQLAFAQEELDLLNAQLAELEESVPELAEKRQLEQNLLSAEQATQTGLDARLNALTALQERVQTHGKLQPWLEAHGLDGLSPLWQHIHVEQGWESAIESALQERLNALEVGQLDQLAAFANGAPPARLAFYSLKEVQSTALTKTNNALSEKLSLTSVELKGLLTEWLHGCKFAKDLHDALKARHTLSQGEAIYVPAGHFVTQHGISFYAPDSEQAGMLARQQEIENLQKQIKAQSLLIEQARSAVVRMDTRFHDAEHKLVALRLQVKEKQEYVHGLQVEAMQLSQQAESAQLRGTQLDHDLDELEAQVQLLQESKSNAEGRFEELDWALADEQEKQARLDELVISAEQALAQGREHSRVLQHRAQEAEFNVRTLKARQQELERMINTAREQILSLQAESERIQVDLEQFDDAAARAGLQDALELKVACEEELSQARQAYEELTQMLRTADEQRMQLSQDLDPLRQKVTDLQLKEQAAQMGVDQYTQALLEAEVSIEEIAKSVQVDRIELSGLQEEIEKLDRQMNALGAVNLAAFEELEASYERKNFLDAQVEDLSGAIRTLENAIVKIDQQTTELLISTFNAVNYHFGKMFPELFGGGHAKLVMTGDEILDSGIQVMAQPPGKRNSTIHLLSGGEKALTAIALVFAIFQLNPAPFCLLDEVDAPLDDANTERYAKLVSRMSEETQFLFISHNKIAMEMAEQLIGVTMQEQGVSRVVAVDMKEALHMANI